jgi:hypothetical protein
VKRPRIAPVVAHSVYDIPAHDREVKTFFGLGPKAKWPDNGLPSTIIGSRFYPGVAVRAFVISKEEAKREGRFQRALCVCPNCSTVMPLGRLNQHWVVHVSAS